jgi:hypothetical protein
LPNLSRAICSSSALSARSMMAAGSPLGIAWRNMSRASSSFSTVVP